MVEDAVSGIVALAPTALRAVLREVNIAASTSVHLLALIKYRGTPPTPVYINTLFSRITTHVVDMVFALPRAVASRGTQLKEISLLGHSLELRAGQLASLPTRYRLCMEPSLTSEERAVNFIRFGNDLSLILLDTLLGFAVGGYLVAHATSLTGGGGGGGILHDSPVEVLHIDVLRSRVHWLMGHPLGLKINIHVASAIGNMVLEVISLWNVLTSVLTPLEPFIVKILGGTLGLTGLTSITAGLNDILWLITLHVNMFYSALLVLYNAILKVRVLHLPSTFAQLLSCPLFPICFRYVVSLFGGDKLAMAAFLW